MSIESRHKRHRAHPNITVEECFRCQRNMAICKYKKVWNTSELARVVAEQINIAENWESPLTTYKCTYCEGYHLTTVKYKHQKKQVEKKRRKYVWRERQKELAS